MPHMLTMATAKIGDPVTFFILVISNYALLHDGTLTFSTSRPTDAELHPPHPRGRPGATIPESKETVSTLRFQPQGSMFPRRSRMTKSGYRIGVVGVGRMGANMARRLHDLQYSIVAVYDADPQRAESLAKELGVRSNPYTSALRRIGQYGVDGGVG